MWKLFAIFLIACYHFLYASSLVIGVSISETFYDQFKRILPSLSLAQDHVWLVCLQRKSIFYEQSLLDLIKSKHGKLLFEKNDIDNSFCGLNRAQSLRENYLLLIMNDANSQSALTKQFPHILFESVSRSVNISFIFVENEVIEDQSCMSNVAECLLLNQNDGRFDFSDIFRAVQNNSEWVEDKSQDSSQSNRESNQIQLWWPLNNTEIFVHKEVPSHLSPLRMKQKFIFSFPSFTGSKKTRMENDWMEVRILDLWHDTPVTGHTLQIVRLPKSTRDQTAEFHAELVEVTIELYHQAGRRNEWKRMFIEVFDIQSDTSLARFPLHLQIVYGTDHWQKSSTYLNSSVTTQSAFLHLHPMFGQLETRDDLGLALSAFLPRASQMVEVGVNEGHFAQLLLETWEELELYVGVDPWRVWPAERYLDIANAVDQTTHDLHYASTIQRLAPYEERVVLIRQTSEEAARLFLNESVDVVYIDAQHHYEAVLQDLLIWWPKVRPGGLLCGHDYLLDVLDNTIFTVKPAVEKFARDHALLLLQTYDTKQPAFPTWLLFKPQLR